MWLMWKSACPASVKPWVRFPVLYKLGMVEHNLHVCALQKQRHVAFGMFKTSLDYIMSFWPIRAT